MLKKVLLKAGINRENTRYTTEGGWYECDKIRFRYGTPEKIGGWQAISTNTYLGVARSFWPWTTLGGSDFLGTGTNLKYYITSGGDYYDITPIRNTTAAGGVTFAATTGSALITATDIAHGCVTGDFVTFSGAASLGGNITAGVLNQEYQVTVVNDDTYTFVATATANSSDTGNGGASTVAAYQVNTGNAIAGPILGWGAGAWGGGAWGIGLAGGGTSAIRIWGHQNFGEDLIFGPKGGALYYWDASAGLGTRGVALSGLPFAADVPSLHNLVLVSDTSRFVLAFGCPDYGSITLDPMLIRWSDQESAVNWTPAATNQAGSLRLSHGSEIVAATQVRQELLVWTDTSLYSLQYLGPPVVWGSQLLADNVTIVSDRAAATAAGVTYWMGDKKFYTYDGRVNALNCDLRQYIFNDFNFIQQQQVFAGTVQQFNEIWWFYCSANSSTVDRYVIYNYAERVWYYGSLARTAWVDSSTFSTLPVAATYANKLVYHEVGVDDLTNTTPEPITAYITSSEFDIEDGERFSFVWRVLPDITFRGSTASTPSATLTLLPLQNSGSGYNNPLSEGGANNGLIARVATVPVEQFTQQVNIRVRGRQLAMKLESNGLGVQWQMGAMRLDLKLDGRKS